jgi:hypothetical protein
MASTIAAGTTSGTAIAIAGDTSGVLQLQTNGTTAAVTIDTSQNVGVGVTSPDGKLTIETANSNTPRIRFQNASFDGDAAISTFVSSTGTDLFLGSNAYINSSGNIARFDSAQAGSYVYAGRTGTLFFGTNSSSGVATERMRIASSGDVLIGGTTTIGDNGILLANADYTATYRSTSTAGAYIHAFASDNGGTRIVKYAIYANGTAGAVSDQNLKKNIEPARNYLDDLMNIEVVKYNWISDEENTPKELGCIAQQVETVFPGMVDEQTYKDGNGEEITQKMLKKEVFIPMMLKAIQELKTELDSVKTELDATKAEVQALKGVA